MHQSDVRDAKAKILKLGRPVRTLAGQKIFSQGDPILFLYYLTIGSVVTTFTSATGHDAMIMDVPSGQFVPMVALLDECFSYPVDGVAQTDCDLVAIEITKLRRLLTIDADVSNYFLTMSLHRVQRVLQQFLNTALLNATGRIAKWLVDVAREQNTELMDGVVIQLDISTHVVGLATAGMARETISRQLTWLVREGIIERSTKTVKVLDIRRLEALCDGTAISRKRI